MWVMKNPNTGRASAQSLFSLQYMAAQTFGCRSS